MSEISNSLLSKSKLTALMSANNEAKKELDKKDGLCEVISKYHQRLWFQRSMFMSENELINYQKILAFECERLELAIDEYKTAIYAHYNATELLHKSMRPFDHITIQNTELTQIALF